jgi:alkylated DNA repair protein alkB family protein 1
MPSISAFREIEKLYQRKHPPPDYTQALHFHCLDLNTYENRQKIINVTQEFLDTWGSQEKQQPSVFRIVDKPGLLVIIDAFTILEQKYWIRNCLVEYTHWTHPTNLGQQTSEQINLWSWTQMSPERRALVSKLRWTTLGYHYNWTTKAYRKDHQTPFPLELALLATRLVDTFTSYKGFVAEAAIINYYQLGDSLMGHCDVSEQVQDAPLVSISFGQDAIFLLGGVSKEETPVALRLCSGDILIMEKEARLAYHGVPRIIENTLPDQLKQISPEDDPPDWKALRDYLQTSRINVNIRQVWGES